MKIEDIAIDASREFRDGLLIDLAWSYFEPFVKMRVMRETDDEEKVAKMLDAEQHKFREYMLGKKKPLTIEEANAQTQEEFDALKAERLKRIFTEATMENPLTIEEVMEQFHALGRNPKIIKHD